MRRKINWKLRLQNKTTLTAIVMACIALVYQVLAMTGIVPPVSQSDVIEVCGMAINLLMLLGIVVDPTTQGIGDSNIALQYDYPILSKQ